MLLKFFHRNQVLPQMVVILLSLVGYISIYYGQEFKIVHFNSDGWLFLKLTENLALNDWFLKIIIILLLGFLGLWTNLMFKFFGMVHRRNYSVFLIWTMLLGFFPWLWNLSASLLAYWISIYGFFLTFKAATHDFKLPELVNLNLVFGIASLIYQPFVGLLIVVFLALLILGKWNIQNILISIVSFALPYLYLFVYFFWQKKTASFLDIFSFQWEWDLPQLGSYNSVSQWILLMGFILFFILMVSQVVQKMNSKLIHIRSISTTILVYIGFYTLLLFVGKADLLGMLMILILPMSAISGLGINELKPSKVWDIILMVLLVSPILLRLVYVGA